MHIQPWTMSLRWKPYWGGPYVLPRAVNDGEEPLNGEWFRRAEAEKYIAGLEDALENISNGDVDIEGDSETSDAEMLMKFAKQALSKGDQE